MLMSVVCVTSKAQEDALLPEAMLMPVGTGEPAPPRGGSRRMALAMDAGELVLPFTSPQHCGALMVWTLESQSGTTLAAVLS